MKELDIDEIKMVLGGSGDGGSPMPPDDDPPPVPMTVIPSTGG